ncbi:hypothetical protein RQP46_005624 [Phenoliferia psychrophenolica]
MCRWFAMLSEEETLLSDVLLRPRHSLVKMIDSHFLPNIHKQFQASDTGSPNPLSNLDGFGVAYYTGKASEFNVDSEDICVLPALYKTVRPPLNDRNLQSLCENTASKAVVAHGTGLTPVVETNNHPFVWGRHVFCHNGVVQDFESIRLELLHLCSPTARAHILGTTDSEHVAALFFTHLNPLGPWLKQYSTDELQAALRTTILDLQRLIDADGQKSNGHSALNFLVSDGEQMIATRFAHPVGREPPSLYWSSTAGPTLSSKYVDHPDAPVENTSTKLKPKSEHGKHIIIASEPTTYRAEEWNLIEANHMVAVGMDLEVHISPV